MTTGTLYVVATPIGNRDDLSLRAVEVLRSVDMIVAEDTRHSRPLLQHFGIVTPLRALHEFNERQIIGELIAALQAGKNLALISDAGTPLLSDPGYHLVRAVRLARMPVSPVPGACALICALSAAGLPSDRFVFEGFLPSRAQARRAHLDTLRHETRTLIFYEACHRIVASLTDMVMAFGSTREAVLARELTKRFETLRLAPLDELLQWVSADPMQQKGEFVVLVRGIESVPEYDADAAGRLLQVLLTELPLKQAVRLVAQFSGEKKNRLYDLALDAAQRAPETHQ